MLELSTCYASVIIPQTTRYTFESGLCNVPDAGELVGCIIMDANDASGCQNFSTGGVVAVPANTLHSAENPSCIPARLMQALSGGVRSLHMHALHLNAST